MIKELDIKQKRLEILYCMAKQGYLNVTKYGEFLKDKENIMWGSYADYILLAIINNKIDEILIEQELKDD